MKIVAVVVEGTITRRGNYAIMRLFILHAKINNIVTIDALIITGSNSII